MDPPIHSTAPSGAHWGRGAGGWGGLGGLGGGGGGWRKALVVGSGGGGGLTLLLANRTLKHICRRKVFLHNKSPYLVDPPPCQQRSQRNGNSKQYICGQFCVHDKTGSIHYSPFP